MKHRNKHFNAYPINFALAKSFVWQFTAFPPAKLFGRGSCVCADSICVEKVVIVFESRLFFGFNTENDGLCPVSPNPNPAFGLRWQLQDCRMLLSQSSISSFQSPHTRSPNIEPPRDFSIWRPNMQLLFLERGCIRSCSKMFRFFRVIADFHN